MLFEEERAAPGTAGPCGTAWKSSRWYYSAVRDGCRHNEEENS